jgi:DNA-binding SARP family transcriptional activator
LLKLVLALSQIRERDLKAAQQTLDSVRATIPTSEPGRLSRYLAVAACLAALREDPIAADLAREAISRANRQGAERHLQLALLALAATDEGLSLEISRTPMRLAASISTSAELIIDNLETLSPDALERVEREAEARPERWSQALRLVLPLDMRHPARLRAARLLDAVGDRSDIPRLRRIAKEPRALPANRTLGRGLARRLAPRVYVSDLGRVRLSVGGTEMSGGSIRRKVLALLVYLLTRPQMTAAREEVMDALWPDIDPDAAANSLNQTLYFLRRVFEPEYNEDNSPGYLRQESDLVLLDQDLVRAASTDCQSLISRLDRDPSPELVERLSLTYVGRFAADFAYEDWAADHRDWLHVSYLQIMETAITKDIAAGKFARGVALARRALEVDPRLDTLGLSLLKLLKGGGAHSAAAEQYQRYATLLRDEIGIEPLPFDSV